MLSKTQEKELLKFSSFYLKTARHLRIEVISTKHHDVTSYLLYALQNSETGNYLL